MDSSRSNTMSRCVKPGRGLAPTLPASLLAALAMVTVAPGCGDSGTDPNVTFRVVGPPTPGSAVGCPVGVESADLSALAFDGVPQPTTVRITYLDSATGDLVCDAVLDFAADNRSVVTLPGTGPVDLVLEFFSADGTRVATGRAHGVEVTTGDPGGEDGEGDTGDAVIAVEVPAQLDGVFGCANAGLASARGFHTATVLPDDTLLIIGGATALNSLGDLAGDAIERSSGLAVTSAVELYDPATGTVTDIPAPGLIARAMHQTYLVSEIDGRVTLAVVGGVTAAAGEAALRFDQDNLDLSIDLAADLGPEVQMLTYDPGAGSIEVQTIAGSAAPPLSASPILGRDDPAALGAQLVVVGGATFEPDGLGGQTFTVSRNLVAYDPIQGVASAGLTNTVARLGATVSDLGDGTALIWGGNLATGANLDNAGEIVSGVAAQTVSALAPRNAASTGFTPRAFHQAIPVGAQQVLMVGGFAIAGGTGNVPVQSLADLVTVGADVLAEPLAISGNVKGAGHVAATALPDGRVLITGGSPDACVQDSLGIGCALSDGYLFDPATSTLSKTDGSLEIARYGHRMSALSDGRVVITGGLHAEGSQVFQTSKDIELVDQSDPTVDAVPALGREPAQVALTDGAPTAACEVSRP